MNNKIICDASSLISLAENNMIELLARYNTDFLIPESVKKEIITQPMHTKRFKLKAIILKDVIDRGMVKIISKDKAIDFETKKINDLANRLLEHRGHFVKIMHEGEAQAIGALSVMKENTFMVDERTTRHLIEDPKKILQYMQGRTKYKLKMNDKALEELQEKLININVIRSSEVVANAYEKGLLPRFGII